MGAPCQPIKQVLPLSWTNFLVSVLRISGPLSEYWASLQGRVMVLGMLMYLLSLVVSGLTGETLDWMSSYITCHHFYIRAEWSRKQCHNVTPPLLGIYWGENNYVLISTMDHIKCLLSLPPLPSLSLSSLIKWNTVLYPPIYSTINRSHSVQTTVGNRQLLFTTRLGSRNYQQI